MVTGANVHDTARRQRLVLGDRRTVSWNGATVASGWRKIRREDGQLCGEVRSGDREGGAELLHEREEVRHTPMLGDLAVLDAHRIDGFELNLPAGRCDPEKIPLVGAVIGFVGRHDVTVRALPVYLCMKIRKRRTQPAIEVARAGLIGRAAGLRRMVEKVVCEELLEQFEVASALDLLRVAPDDRLSGVADRTIGHVDLPPARSHSLSPE